MFSKRTNSQKPHGELISRFQQTFANTIPWLPSSVPDVGPVNEGAGGHDIPARYRTTEDNSVELEHSSRFLEFSIDHTPQNLQDFGLTTCWMDTAPIPLKPPASQYRDFHTPGSGEMGTIFHNQAGDLHTPRMQINNVNPLSLWNPTPIPHFNPQGDLVDQFGPFFTQKLPSFGFYADQFSHVPGTINQGRSVHDGMDESGDHLSTNEMQANLPSDPTPFTDTSTQVSMRDGDVEDLRFKVSLLDTIAVDNHTTGIPVTYLNKGQTYNLKVVDLKVPVISTELIQYRTFVRVAFEEEEQRSNPVACWQLWKEGRGLHEARQRGGKLLAVEHVDLHQGGHDHLKHRQIHVECTSFDGFCITWTTNPATGTSDCTIPIRFYFLSTDFSRSKGVKGIPVRLCVKTEILLPRAASEVMTEPEVCYCRVKLFRDHGAERKLSNDISHLKKTIERLQQRIPQAQTDSHSKKRKRTNRPIKPWKYKHTLSIGSQVGVHQDETSEIMFLIEDLEAKLVIMQDMFSSRRSVSILYLRGDEKDDPDRYPILLANDGDLRSATFDCHHASDSQRMESAIHFSSSNVAIPPHKHSSPGAEIFQRLTTIQRFPGGSNGNDLTDLLEAIGIDPNYRPPAGLHLKPIACFYFRFTGDYKHPQDYYRAIYLQDRTVRDLVYQICQIHQIDSTRIVRILHVNHSGRRVLVDDNVVRELPEGQDMVAGIYETLDPVGLDADTDGSAIEIKLEF